MRSIKDEVVVSRELPIEGGHKNIIFDFTFKLVGNKSEVDHRPYFGILFYAPSPNDSPITRISGYGIKLTPLGEDDPPFENVEIIDIPLRFPFVVIDESLEVVVGSDEAYFVPEGGLYSSLAREQYPLEYNTEYHARIIIGDHHNLEFYIENNGEYEQVISGPAHEPVNSIVNVDYPGYDPINHNFDYFQIFVANSTDSVTWGVSDLVVRRYGNRYAFLVFDFVVPDPGDDNPIGLTISGNPPVADDSGRVWNLWVRNNQTDSWERLDYIYSSDYSGSIAEKGINVPGSYLIGDSEKRAVLAISNVVGDNVDLQQNISIDFISFSKEAPFVHAGGKFDVWVNYGDISVATEQLSGSDINFLYGSIIQWQPINPPVAWINSIEVDGNPMGFKLFPENHLRGSVNEKWRIVPDSPIGGNSVLRIDYYFMDEIGALDNLVKGRYVSGVPVVKTFWPAMIELLVEGVDLDLEAIRIAVNQMIRKKQRIFAGEIIYNLMNQGFRIMSMTMNLKYIDENGKRVKQDDVKDITIPNEWYRFICYEVNVSNG